MPAGPAGRSSGGLAQVNLRPRLVGRERKRASAIPSVAPLGKPPPRARWPVKLGAVTLHILLVLLAVIGTSIIFSSEAMAAAAPTVVSFTFDDGVANQLAAAASLQRNGMQGTFYVNSGLIGSPGYFSRPDLTRIAAAGNEIGGHTVLHPHLTAVAPDEARREICLDRQNLIDWGFQPRSLAYPYSAYNPSTEQFARECGYDSAREVGDLVSRAGCASCDVAERIPPVDPYRIRTPGEVDPSWTLADMQARVLAVERSGGGWLPMVFHGICDGCSSIGVNPSTFAVFVEWLKERAPRGTVVRTVGDVVGQPEMSAPVHIGAGPNHALLNPSLESLDPTGQPTCWGLGVSGQNKASAEIVTDAFSGRSAMRVSMQDYVSGDAKLLPTMDLGQCAPSASAGRQYTVSVSYRSDVQAQFALYTRDETGKWTYWTSSPAYPASAGWAQATWTSPDTPLNTTAVSFGMSIKSNGSLLTDNYHFVVVATSGVGSEDLAIWIPVAIFLAVILALVLYATRRRMRRHGQTDGWRAFTLLRHPSLSGVNRGRTSTPHDPAV